MGSINYVMEVFMFNKKLNLIILSIFILAAPIFTACDDTGNKNNESSENLTSGINDNTFPLAKKNFDTTIKILAVESGRHTYGEMQFAPDDEITANVINDAVGTRNSYIEQEYGIKIEVVGVTKPGEEIKNAITSGSDEFQIVADCVYNMLPNATENYYQSLENDLKLDSLWWDQNAIENLSITDKTYFVAGDALITDDDHTYLMLYNKEIYSNHGDCEAKYGDIYQLVEDGKWTIDTMYEMSKAVTMPNASGELLKPDCTYGFLGDGNGANILVFGSGTTTAEKTSDGGMQLMVNTDKSINAFEKVFNLMSDQSAALYVEKLGEEGWTTISDMFIGGKGLFYCTTTQSITSILNNETDDKVTYGVLPIPKYNDLQDKYYNGINVFQSTVMGVPITNDENYDATIYLMEALGFYSKNISGTSVSKAYYDTTLKLQASDSSKDEDMLDIIFDNRLYDIGSIYNWGGLTDTYSAVMRSGANTLTSTFDSKKDGVQTKMDETIEKYKNIN